MKTRVTHIAIFLLFITISAANAQDSIWPREYKVNIYNNYDLRNSYTKGIAVNRMVQDVFRKNVKPLMPDKLGNITYGFYSFATTYLTMLWSHEFGHSMRAKQVGGEFRIHNAALPIPYTTMHLPDDISLDEEALSVTGGFEVNYSIARQLQSEFITNNGLFNEDLSFAFANRIFYTIYTSLIVRIDPEVPDVWINTAGDPVHCVLPVFKNFSNDKVFLEDGKVNPELVSFYNQSAIFGSFFSLLDPNFYAEVSAAFGKSKVRRPRFLLGNHESGWTYGTLFSVSPLGYELYLNNYLHIRGNQFRIAARYGKPYKNVGIGIKWSNAVDIQKLKMSVELEVWDQDIYGTGIAGEIETMYNIFKNIDLNLSLGYKTEGFVMGRHLDQGLILGGGLVLRGSYY